MVNGYEQYLLAIEKKHKSIAYVSVKITKKEKRIRHKRNKERERKQRCNARKAQRKKQQKKSQSKGENVS